MAITKKIAQPLFLAVLILGLTQNFAIAAADNIEEIRAERFLGRYGTKSLKAQRRQDTRALRADLITYRGKVSEIEGQVAALVAGGDPLAQARIAQLNITIGSYNQNIMDIEADLTDLTTLDTVSGKIGKALLQGFAGKDAQLFIEDHMESWTTGLGLGLTVATAQHASKSVGKIVEETADLVIGGTWTGFLNKLVAFMQFISNGIFHGGYKPYSVVTLRGIQEMVKVTFQELGKTLNKAVQDKTRGVDMTLRPTDDQAQAVARINGWEKICEAYIRQFDHIIVVLDERILHYEHNPDVVFYANEIVHCITDVKALLRDGKNMRDLYERLDSNQALINAFNANISNLFNRLVELVDQPVSKGSNGSTQPKPTAPNPRPSYADRDESMFGHSFSGN